jgi:signal transduction histidine kinase
MLKHFALPIQILLTFALAIGVLALATTQIDVALQPSFAENSSAGVRWTVLANLALAGAVIAFVGFGFAYAVRRRWKPLTSALAYLPERQLNRIEGSDEAAKVASALNRMAHELREQKALMNEFVTLASRELLDSTADSHAALKELDGASMLEEKGVILRVGARMQKQLRFVSRLITAARAQCGTLALSKSRVDVYRLVDSVARDLQPVVDSRNQRITIKDPGYPVVVLLDEQKMHEVIGSLIGNATKFTGESGRIEVTISDLGTSASISIRDSGVGIPPEELGDVFKKVCRFDDRGTLKGARLGLFIASQVIKLHGGDIAVESSTGKGSRFTIKLPKTQD